MPTDNPYWDEFDQLESDDRRPKPLPLMPEDEDCPNPDSPSEQSE